MQASLWRCKLQKPFFNFLYLCGLKSPEIPSIPVKKSALIRVICGKISACGALLPGSSKTKRRRNRSLSAAALPIHATPTPNTEALFENLRIFSASSPLEARKKSPENPSIPVKKA